MSVSSGTEAGSGVPSRESEEFATEVRGMFDRIAGVYDLMNSAMTAGLHHQWRQRAVDRAEVGPGSDALDICCGTGDLALELRRRIGPDGRVVGSDFSEPMLELARRKSGEQGLPVEFGWADALELPYGDVSFDAVTIGFGARNLADLDRGLAEMTRVLRPGGLLLALVRPNRAGDRHAGRRSGRVQLSAEFGAHLPRAARARFHDERRRPGADSMAAARRRDHRH